MKPKFSKRLQTSKAIFVAQESFFDDKLEEESDILVEKLRKMCPKPSDEEQLRLALQYFLATLCDMRVPEEQKSRLGLRYQGTPEVKKLLKKLQKGKMVAAQNSAPNAIVSALKEILSAFPGGIFDPICDQFLAISLHSPLEIIIVYLHGLLDTFPSGRRQLVYLVCRSLANLAQQCDGEMVQTYTDLLMLFAPTLFPSALGDVSKYMVAVRLTLIMVDLCDQVFKPYVWLDSNSNCWQSLSEDDAFFYQMVASLQRLENHYKELESDDEYAMIKQQSVDCDTSISSGTPMTPNEEFYRFTYVD